MRIPGMSRTARRREVHHESAFLGHSQLVFRRLTDNNESRLPLERVRQFCTATVAFFTHDKQKTETIDALTSKSIPGFEHRGNDSLCIAGTTTVHELLVLMYRQNGRNGVHMRAKNHARPPCEGQNVEPIRYEELLLHPIT